MRTRSLLATLALLAGAATAACSSDTAAPVAPARVAAQAQVMDFTPVSFEFSGGQLVDCLNGGAGEWIEFSGVQHGDINSVTDAAGGSHWMLRFNSSSLSGVGNSGAVYQGRSSGMERELSRNGDGTGMLRFAVAYTGRGTAGNFRLDYFGKVRTTADGSYEVVRDSTRISCR